MIKNEFSDMYTAYIIFSTVLYCFLAVVVCIIVLEIWEISKPLTKHKKRLRKKEKDA